MRRAAILLVVAGAMSACTAPGGGQSSRPTTPTSASTLAPAEVDGPAGLDLLAQLRVDDNPSPDRRYDRDDWPDWADTDGDGCDARQQSLRSHSSSPAQVDPIGCTVLTGDWLSVYDGVETSDPGDLDIDHIVPLENAHNSGGWQWTAAQRRLFSNDQANLVPVSASSNRSKGSRLPNEWRPPREDAWCFTAESWVATKDRWQLSVTTEERDALGDMLERCI